MFLDTPDGAWLKDITDTTERVLMAPRNHPEQAVYLSDSAWTSFGWGYGGQGSPFFSAQASRPESSISWMERGRS